MSDRPMTARENGSAMFYSFIVTLLLFLAAGYFAFAIFSKNEELRTAAQEWQAEKKEMQAQLLLRNQYIEAVSQAVGETGEYTGKEGFNWEEYGGQPAALQNVTLPGRYVSTMGDALASIGQPKDAKGLTAALSYVKQKVSDLETQVNNAKAEAAERATQIAQLQQSASEAARSKDQEIRDLNSQISDASSRFQSEIDRVDNLAQTANNLNAQLRQQVADEKEAALNQAIEFNKRINTLTAQNTAYSQKLRMINPPTAADGKVLSANQGVSRAWIDIGRNDMLKLGTKFRIIDPGTGEKKANGEVITLEGNRAEILISDLADRYQPVVPGDVVANDLYSPQLRRNIYLMGRFSLPYSKPAVTAYLENIGNKVVDEIGVGVDLIVVGQDSINEEGDGYTPITETEEYKRANELSIQFVRLSQIKDLLTTSTSSAVVGSSN